MPMYLVLRSITPRGLAAALALSVVLMSDTSLHAGSGGAGGRTPPPAPTVMVLTHVVAEDGWVDVHLDATSNAGPGVQMTVSISGIPADWSVLPYDGDYNAKTGVWTLTLPPGTTNFLGGPSLGPPANSDADSNNLADLAVNTDTASGLTSQASTTFFVVVDAAADVPALSVAGGSVDEGLPAPLDINTFVTDTDGSEEIAAILVSNVPGGFTLSAGTHVTANTWQLSPADLPGLTISPAIDHIGPIELAIQSTAEEVNFSGIELDSSNDIAFNQAVTEVVWIRVPCNSDTNEDSRIDVQDMLNVITGWGACAQCPADVAPTSGDNMVDVADLLAVISHWGPCG